ncbi:beta-lactamase [Brevibacillus reuszeri]|uniref:Beta-lactamase n=1 Tax=Brevibacillus reuszeri TaxID=54915 RepID=A0A0K9YKH8_9BACL|nr:serine hydrolase [Brevibacillus reuszeri]KNB69263.1 hypothetical protein ADS79_25475 [Brevibacillus reuszeri]MED1860208.1 class A beta-lactamase-related serine hydrolase [Brevibacillus reuszeri]GED71593.1 beta-lactamase [Brevibacillus reuszeri]
MSLQQKLEDLLRETRGTFGIAVKNLQTGEEASINADRLFQLASVFKIPILATLYRDVEAGKQTLEQRITITETDNVPGSTILASLDWGVELTMKDLAMLMIIVSDNVATDVLLKMIGVQNVDSYMKQLGLENTFINHSCWELLSLCVGMEPHPYSPEIYAQFFTREFDEENIVFKADKRGNVSTATEMSRLVEMIANEQLLTKTSTDGMMDILGRQQFKNRLPQLLPSQAKVAHKTGTLPPGFTISENTTIGSIVNDVGIVYMPKDKGAFTIAVLSQGNPSVADGERMIARIARTAYDHFMM